MWDTATGEEVATLTGHTADVPGVAFNHDGAQIATASNDDTAKVWDLVGRSGNPASAYLRQSRDTTDSVPQQETIP